MGGGTFDVSLISMEYGVFTVLATAGDMHLGGEDFDQRLVEYFVELYLKKSKKDCTQDKRAMALLKQEAEKAKRALSSRMSVHVEIKGFFNGDNFSEEISRDTFERINMDLFEKTMKSVQQVLGDASGKVWPVDDIILTGRSTSIPMINDLLRKYFNSKEMLKSIVKGKGPFRSTNPRADLKGKGPLRSINQSVQFKRKEMLRSINTRSYIEGKEPLRFINLHMHYMQTGSLWATHPDEAVVNGAAVLYVNHIILTDIVPLTLGFRTTGGTMTPVMFRGTRTPTTKTNIISTIEDNQETIIIQVYEAEPMMMYHKMLGAFELKNIPPSSRGVPQIKVSFEIDVDGILHVSAHNKATGKPIAINMYRLSHEEFNRMINESEEFRTVKALKDKVDAKNALEEYLFDLKRELNDRLGRILSSDDKKKVLDTVNQGLEWLELNAITVSMEDFVKMMKNDLNPVLAQVYGRTYGFDEDEYL